MKQPRIGVMGSINMDLVVRCATLPKPGQTITATEFLQIPGGKGANQAVAAARLGAQVAMIGRVGNDAIGKSLLDQLRAEQVNVESVRTSECSSGIAIVAVEQTGQNAIMVVPGANAHVSVHDVEDSRLVIEQADVLLAQLETPIDAVLASIQIARHAGKLIVLNPAPLSMPFDDRLFDVDLLCPNQTEAEQSLAISIVSIDDALAAAAKIVERGARNAIITLGERGAVWSNGIETLYSPAFAIHAVDTTAAGDAFCAAIAICLARKLPFERALRWACAAGALTTSRLGAQFSLPIEIDVDKLASSGN